MSVCSSWTLHLFCTYRRDCVLALSSKYRRDVMLNYSSAFWCHSLPEPAHCYSMLLPLLCFWTCLGKPKRERDLWKSQMGWMTHLCKFRRPAGKNKLCNSGLRWCRRVSCISEDSWRVSRLLRTGDADAMWCHSWDLWFLRGNSIWS